MFTLTWIILQLTCTLLFYRYKYASYYRYRYPNYNIHSTTIQVYYSCDLY